MDNSRLGKGKGENDKSIKGDKSSKGDIS